LQSKVAQKEQFWKQNDGTEVDEDDIVEGYYYGDKLVPFDAIEKDNQYKTGEKCLKVLLFCPRETIQGYHLVGDGFDLVFPKKNAVDAEFNYLALMQAMINTDRIAIVRKVRTTNAKVVLGALVPCLTRQCLLFCEICFADDVSIPSFAPLIKPETLTEEPLDEKDSLMDEFIKSRTIANFTPTEGPVDPAVPTMREHISRKFVGPSTLDTDSSMTMDGIDLYFEELVKGTDEDLLRKLKDSFPLKEIVEKGSDRPSGQQIFRKRTRELEGIENAGAEGEKKTKTEGEVAEPDPAVKAEMDAAADMFDPDNLLDDM